jgi:hypothetical protein
VFSDGVIAVVGCHDTSNKQALNRPWSTLMSNVTSIRVP